MRIDATTLVFFDASCLVAAAGRPTGGAGYVLSLCSRDLLRGAVSHPVLVEAERNIRRRLPPPALTTYHELLMTTTVVVVPIPDALDQRGYVGIAGEKDAHVVVAAVAAGAPFLLTLDKPLARRVNEAGLSPRALSPGEFINGVLPQHINAGRLRS